MGLRLLTILIIFSLNVDAQITQLPARRFEYLNMSLTGNPPVTGTNNQDTLINIYSCSPPPQFNQPDYANICYNTINRPLTGGFFGHVVYPLTFIIDTKTHTNFKRIGIYFGDPADGVTGNKLTVTTGDPISFQDTIVVITDNNSLTRTWKTYTVPDYGINQQIQLSFNGQFREIQAVTLYGIVVDTIADVIPMPIAINNNARFGTNFIFGMGYGDDGVNRINYMKQFNIARCYEYFSFSRQNYYDTTHNLLNGSGQSDFQLQQSDTLINAGNNFHIVYSAVGSAECYPPWKRFGQPGYDGTISWDGAKPIPYYMNAIGDTSANGLPYFEVGQVAENPASYAGRGYDAANLGSSLGDRTYPFQAIEFGNELEYTFNAPTKLMYPKQMYAMLTTLYDGDEGRVTYNGHPVGIKNSGTNIKLIMSALATFNYNYFQCLAYLAKYKRSDHKLPFDFINDHSYPNSTLVFGANGKGVPPEDVVFNLKGKMDSLKNFGNQQGLPVLQTEIGYDNFEKYSTSEFCDSASGTTYGGSFQNTPVVPGQTIIQTNGNMIARTMLVMASTNIPYYHYWMADQYDSAGYKVCGTFNASGLDEIVQQINFIPYYFKRPAWYYFQTVKNLTNGYDFVSDTLLVIGSDSVRVDKYRKSDSTQKVVYALWSPTIKNASFSYTLTTTNTGSYTVKALVSGSETGQTIAIGNGQSIPLTVSETPVFVVQTVSDTPSPGYFISRDRFVDGSGH